MKTAITAIQVSVEMTPYNEAGQVMPRPQVAPIVAFEADIPKAVLDWLRGKLPPGAIDGK